MTLPPTNNQDLDAEIDSMLTWDINGKKEPVIFRPEMKKAIKKLVASHQSSLIDRVLEKLPQEQDVRPEITEWIISKDYSLGFNKALKEVRKELIKMKDKL